ncbi:hypothetical protein NP233_g3074 [Leucocoprinus birnbaumii]|uniref:D-lactate dehydratase n=1 Tax=Leucocoprinus birnbaumii TaxID=56174 RepID=A0AAD5YYL1_9AGAR|nr:hypothetical protein NP233_g3074 [Leucocoprinus birnbaumii]
MAPRILFVFTSADKSLTGSQTGYWVSEAAHPYYVLSPHFDIDFASPIKNKFPADPTSINSAQDLKDSHALNFLTDPKVAEKQATGKTLTEVDPKGYAAIFYIGGHGPVIDLASDPNNAKLIEAFWEQDKYVAAVCHGPAALAGARRNGKSIFADKKATGFTNTEEEAVKGASLIPWLLEDKIKELGGAFERAGDWQPYVVVDGKLITGQNPASAEPLAKKLLEALA